MSTAMGHKDPRTHLLSGTLAGMLVFKGLSLALLAASAAVPAIHNGGRMLPTSAAWKIPSVI